MGFTNAVLEVFKLRFKILFVLISKCGCVGEVHFFGIIVVVGCTVLIEDCIMVRVICGKSCVG